MSVADFDGDGNADIVVNKSDSSLEVGLGNGELGFHPVEWSDPGGSRTLVADVDADGIDDLIVARAEESEVAVYRGGSGFPPHAPRVTISDNRPDGLALADFDGDGNLDLITAGRDQMGSVLVFLGEGGGEFAMEPSFSLDLENELDDLVVGDWNGDGAVDAAACSSGARSLSILLADKDTASFM